LYSEALNKPGPLIILRNEALHRTFQVDPEVCRLAVVRNVRYRILMGNVKGDE